MTRKGLAYPQTAHAIEPPGPRRPPAPLRAGWVEFVDGPDRGRRLTWGAFSDMLRDEIVAAPVTVRFGAYRVEVRRVEEAE